MLPNALLKIGVSVTFSLLSQFTFSQCNITLNDKFVICDYEELPLPLQSGLEVSGGSQSYSYYWDCFWELYPGSSITMDEHDILNDPTSSHPIIINTEPGDTLHFHLTVTDSEQNTCEASILVITSCFPTTLLGVCEWDTVNPGESVVLCTEVYSCIEPTSYAWSPSNTLNDSTIRFPTALPTENTLYTVTLTDPLGCSATSDMQIFIATTDISNELQSEFKVLQNVTERTLRIQFPYADTWDVEIYSMNGAQIKIEQAIHPVQHTVNVSFLHSGIYMVICKDPNGLVFSQKILLL